MSVQVRALEGDARLLDFRGSPPPAVRTGASSTGTDGSGERRSWWPMDGQGDVVGGGESAARVDGDGSPDAGEGRDPAEGDAVPQTKLSRQGHRLIDRLN
jgi:hypothetical protein